MAELMKYNPGFLDDDTLTRIIVVRRRELELLLEPFAEPPAPANPHRLVLGLRGMGKTALVRRVAAALRREPELAARWHPVLFPEESYQVGTAGELWLEALLHLDDPSGRDWVTIHDALRRERDDQRLHDAALAHLLDFADEQGKRLVLVVENLQMILDEQVADSEGWVLRRTLLNEPRLFLLATATQRFDAMEGEKSPFYELFESLTLEPLSNDECRTLWHSTNASQLHPQRARAIRILTGGNPRLLVLLAQFAQGLSFSSLLRELNSLVDEHTDYFKGHLEAYRGKERRVFAALAEQWEPATAARVAEAARLGVSETSARLGRLVNKGAVRVVDKRGKALLYQISQRLYNLYYLMRCRGGPRDRVRAVVGFMVALYDTPDLVRHIARLADECCGGWDSAHLGGFALCEALLNALPEEARWQALRSTPSSFWEQAQAPRHLLARDEVPLAAEPGSEIVSQPPSLEALRAATQAKPADAQVWRNLAMWLLESKGDLSESESAVRKVLELAPADAGGWILLLAILQERGQQTAAEAALVKALERCPAEPWLLSQQAWARYGQGEDREAIALLERAVAGKPQLAEAWGMLGRILRQQGGDPGRAEDCLRRAISEDPELLPAWKDLFMLLHSVGRVEDTVELAAQEIGRRPDGYAPHCARGIALHQLPGRSDEAEQDLTRATELKPNGITAWGHLGDLLRDKGRHAEAEAAYRRIVELEPRHSQGWSALGSILLDQDRPGEAERAWEQATMIHAEDAAAWNNLAVARLRQEKLDAAEDAFRRALEHDPSFAPAWANLGAVLAENEVRRGEAIDAFLRAIDAERPFWPAWDGLSALLFEDLEPPQALERIEALLPQEPQPYVLNSLAWAAYQARPNLAVLEQGVLWAREAVDARPDSSPSHHTLACLLGALSRWDQAWEHVQPVLDDRELMERELPEVIELFVLAAASDQVEVALKRIRSSPNAELLEPMEAALATLAGERPLPPQEVKEMVEDILVSVVKRRLELRDLS